MEPPDDPKEDPNVMQTPADLPGRTVLVLYASDTGTSQNLAEELGEMITRLHFKTRMDEMNGFPLSALLQYTLIVFVVSTTGQGDMPRNALEMWKSLLRKKLPPDCLAAMKYAILGLGDSSYQKFNWAARKLRKRLTQLGAEEFYPQGEADERHPDGVDGIYIRWAADLRARLLATYPLPASLSPIPDTITLPPRYRLKFASVLDSSRDTEMGPPVLGSQLRADCPVFVPRTELFDDIGKPAAVYDCRNGVAHDLECQPEALAEAWGSSECQICEIEKDEKDESSWLRAAARHLNVLKGSAQLYDISGLNLSDVTVDYEANRHAGLQVPRRCTLRLVENSRLTPLEYWQDVRFLSFVDDSEIYSDPSLPQFQAGDTITLYPKNSLQDALRLRKRMNWGLELFRVVCLQDMKELPSGLKINGEKAWTPFDLILHCLDITAVPCRCFLKRIAHFTADEDHKTRLLELADPKFTDEFFDYTSRPRRTIIEVLSEFYSVKIPVDQILDVFPVIRGREYSICSVTQDTPEWVGSGQGFRKLGIIVALVDYKTILRMARSGFCSRYLRNLAPGEIIHASYNPARSPRGGVEHGRRPLLAIATGTGIAPIHALICERMRQRHLVYGEMNLIFGCRERKTDFYFASEWEGMETHLKVFPAFSRPAQGEGRKKYVQDVVLEQSQLVARMIRQKAIFWICGGSTAMAENVKVNIMKVMVDEKIVSDELEAEALYETLDIIQEIW